MSDLLPINATPQERALSAALARAGEVPVRVREMWSPDTIPQGVLPWLAWALSIDTWDPAWSVAQKRAAVKNAIAVQEKKGTIGAVRDALGAIDLDARVLEWHRRQVPGSPYTYELLLDTTPGAPAGTLNAILSITDAVDRTKSLRSHLDAIRISTSATAGPFVAAAACTGSEIVVLYGGPVT